MLIKALLNGTIGILITICCRHKALQHRTPYMYHIHRKSWDPILHPFPNFKHSLFQTTIVIMAMMIIHFSRKTDAITRTSHAYTKWAWLVKGILTLSTESISIDLLDFHMILSGILITTIQIPDKIMGLNVVCIHFPSAGICIIFSVWELSEWRFFYTSK